jgi:UrcA family protein
MRTIVFSLGIAAACLAVNPALAGEAELAWNDLDLTTAAGKAELDARIEAAAKQVCTSGPVTGSMITRRATPRCLADAREAIAARVTAKLGSGQLAVSGGGAASDARR